MLLISIYFLAAMIGGYFLKSQPLLMAYLSRLPLSLLLILNGLIVFTGLPLTAVGDLLLLSRIGYRYIIFWPLFVGFASCVQIFFFRLKFIDLQHSGFIKRLQDKAKSYAIPFFPRQAFVVLLIRSAPILPFMLGSFVISLLPALSDKTIVLASVLGSYLYYSYFSAGYFLGSALLGS